MPQLHALLVGINEYHPESGVSPLSGCLNDINYLKRFLEINFQSLNPSFKTLRNAHATRDNILRHFQEHLIAAAQEGDFVLFCYAGHGSYARAAPEFARFDGMQQDETLVAYDSRLPGNHDIADKELAVLLSKIPKGVQTVVILDSCHSASATRNLGTPSGLRSMRFTSGRNGSRSLDTYFGDFYQKQWSETGQITIPTSSHLLIAACNRHESAWETEDGRGLFSTHFWTGLFLNPSLSYRAAFDRTRYKVRQETDEQTPVMQVYGDFDPEKSFLSNKKQENRAPLPLLYQNYQWYLPLGALDGLPLDAETPLSVSIYEKTDHGEQHLVGNAEVKNVLLKTSELHLPAGTFLSNEGFYFGKLANFPASLMVLLNGSYDEMQAFLSEADTVNTPELEWVWDETLTNYQLKIEHDSLLIYKNKEELIHGCRGTDARAVHYIIAILQKIAQWERLNALQNQQSSMSAEELEVRFIHEDANTGAKTVMETNEIWFNYPKVGEDLDAFGDPVANYYQIEARNTGGRKLFVSLVNLNSHYGINIHFPVQVLPPQNRWITLDNQHGLAILDSQKQAITDVFKIIVSTTPFDDYPLLSKGFEVGKVVDAPAPRRTAIKRRNASRSDWQIKTITVHTQRTQQVIGNQEVVIPDTQWRILPHSQLKGSVSLATTKASRGRSAYPLAEIHSLITEGSDIMVFEKGKRSLNNSSIIEISNLENEENLQENPLKLVWEGKLKSSEQIIPVTHDGEFFIPVGSAVSQENGSTLVEITEMPVVPAKKRSITRAFWFFMLKTIGQTNHIFKLRWVSYGHNSKPHRNTRGIQRKIEKADRILLVLHGIIGDTKPMLQHLEYLYQQEYYDLILTFDYENLNEPIEKIAEQLRLQLKERGLEPGTDKHIDLLVHSMGGLVSRYLLEQLFKGQPFAKNLWMFGTPNGGSPFGEIPQYRDMLVKLLTFALNFGASWLAPISAYLTSFNTALVATQPLTITLAQMGGESDFTKKLWENAVASDTRYHLIAGDIYQYQTNQERLKRFLEKILLGIGTLANQSQPNDVAVAVDAMKNMPDLLNAEVTVIGCHHCNYFVQPDSLAILEELVKRSRE